MEIIKKNFGEQLKACRKIRNLTQEKLAEQIGVNLRQLARIESGESFVTAETLYNICTVLDISPKILFDFEIKDEILMTGSGNNVYFKVIKNGNLIQLVNKQTEAEKSLDEDNRDFDNKMLKAASNINKNIVVDEVKDGIVYQTKIYKPNGGIDIKNINFENENYNSLLNSVREIKNDNKKINYLNLAYKSLTNLEALEELKSMIKGIELTLS